MKKILFFVVITLLTTNSFAQYPKEFPSDNVGYSKALGDFIKQTCTREDCKQMAEKFPTIIKSTKTQPYLPKIQAISKAMLEKKILAYPGFYNFCLLVSITDTAKVNTAIIDKNYDILLQLITKNKQTKDFSAYLDYLNAFYAKNLLYNSNTKNWKTTNADYKIDLINDKPEYTINNTDIIGTTSADTIVLRNVSGKYYPLEDKWIGTKGKITLQRAGFDPTTNFIEFNNHEINFEKADFTIDSAKFSFKPFLNTTELGTYSDKLLQTKSSNPSNPKFTSYDKNIPFNSLSKEIKFVGGFELQGNKIYGVGSDTSLPKLTVLSKENKEIIIVRAKRFEIKNFIDIDVEDADLTLNLKDNKLTHPFIHFKYTSKTKDVIASKGTKSLSKQPFTSDYHQIFIYADEMRWNIDSSIIKFIMLSLSGDKPAVFESYNFYQPGIDDKYKGATEMSPIQKIYRHYESMEDRHVSGVGVASDLNAGAPYQATENIFYKLQEDGYINYDPSTKEIYVKDKLINQGKASLKKQDYDQIKFASFKSNLSPNARLDIKTNKLTVYGVSEINLSYKSNVKFYPTTDTVIIDKNRNMQLSGKIEAGKADFYAQKVDFDYEKYAFIMKNVEKMVLLVPDGEPNFKGEVKLIQGKTPIENISGNLFISEPTNKSGNKANLKYPYFSSVDTAKVNYDKGNNGEKYKKDNFFYQVDPFELDSLNDINTETIDFGGTLKSGGIFDPIKTPLHLQKDKSMGFDISTPDKGYDMYGKKAKFYNEVKLGNSGLTGKGLFEFGSIKAYADTAFFFLDSTYAELDSMTIKEDKKLNFPQANITQSFFIWSVKKDSVEFFPKEKNKFSLYENLMSLDGNLVLTNSKLSGKGNLVFGKTSLESNLFNFYARTFDTKNAKLKLTNEEGVSLLSSNDVDAKFDLDKKITDIVLNKGDTIPLESFKYVANPKYLTFDLTNNILKLKSINPTSKFFLLSTDINKDSLKFETTDAELNLKDNTIHFGGITDLKLADSKVLPQNKEIFIEADGSIRTLKNAEITFNADKKYHIVKNAEIIVEGKNKFSGKGVYELKSTEGIMQPIEITEITVENTNEIKTNKKGKPDKNFFDINKISVLAKGSIPEEKPIKITKNIFYKGDISFNSKEKDLQLNGFMQFEIAKKMSDWIPTKQAIDPNNPAFNMDSIFQNSNLYTGIFLDKSIPEFYQTILQDKRDKNDAEIFVSNGALSNSKTEPNTVIFGDEKAFTSPYSKNTCLRYNEITNEMNVNGEIGFGLNLGENKISSVGTLKYLPNNNNLNIVADLALKLVANPIVLEYVLNEFNNNDSLPKFISYKKNKPLQRTLNVLTKDTLESNNLLAKIYQIDSIYKPNSLDYNLLFSGTNFTWDANEATFKSISKISIPFYENYLIKREYTAYIELGYGSPTDFINILLENKSGQWLFLKIKSTQMGIASSVISIPDYLMLAKLAEKQTKQGKNIIFEIMPADISLKDEFMERMTNFTEANKK